MSHEGSPLSSLPRTRTHGLDAQGLEVRLCVVIVSLAEVDGAVAARKRQPCVWLACMKPAGFETERILRCSAAPALARVPATCICPLDSRSQSRCQIITKEDGIRFSLAENNSVSAKVQSITAHCGNIAAVDDSVEPQQEGHAPAVGLIL